jgi:hypothetical protein
MSRIAPLAAALGLQLLSATSANAQLPFYTLPKDDFIWNWGDSGFEDRRRGSADIEISGNESFFRCDLTARMRPSSSLSPTDIRAIEQDLQTKLDFIYAVSEAMNYLEFNRSLEWATLDCKKYEAGPSDPEEKANRENDAREKMLRELERRRARQQRDDD